MKLPHDDDRSVEDFCTVPDGRYRVRVVEARPGSTRDGSPRISLRLRVADGPQVGNQAAWDSLVWSPRGRQRLASVCAALGVQVGDHFPTPDQFEGREAIATIEAREYESPSGCVVRRCEVPYAGWEALP